MKKKKKELTYQRKKDSTVNRSVTIIIISNSSLPLSGVFFSSLFLISGPLGGKHHEGARNAGGAVLHFKIRQFVCNTKKDTLPRFTVLFILWFVAAMVTIVGHGGTRAELFSFFFSFIFFFFRYLVVILIRSLEVTQMSKKQF